LEPLGCPKHDPIQHPNAPSISEDLTEQAFVRAAEICDTLSKETSHNPAHRGRGAVNPFPFFVGYFQWAFSNCFYVRLS
jgi:hypothetical protein